MSSKIKMILLGVCYGVCAMLLMRGGVVKPLLLSQILGVVVCVLAIRKVIKNIPEAWIAIGFVVGGFLSLLIKL